MDALYRAFLFRILDESLDLELIALEDVMAAEALADSMGICPYWMVPAPSYVFRGRKRLFRRARSATA